MSGSSTFSGTTFQAKVAAYIFVHILTGRRLSWIAPTLDVPTGVEAETAGPGDDCLVRFDGGQQCFEVQAKHGQKGGQQLADALEGIAARIRKSGQDGDPIVLAVSESSSRFIKQNFTDDLDRIRCGRLDAISSETRDFLGSFAAYENVLSRLRVVTLDLDRPEGVHVKLAAEYLRNALVDTAQVEAAWSILAEESSAIASKRLARSRPQLVGLLKGSGISLKPFGADEKWMADLDANQRLLDSHHVYAALKTLQELEPALQASSASASVRGRANQQRASALMKLDRFSEAELYARRSLELDPSNSRAACVAAHALLAVGRGDEALERARQAIAIAPEDARSWANAAIIFHGMNVHLPSVPSAIAGTAEYKKALMDVAGFSGDWTQVLSLSAEVLQSEGRPIGVVFARAYAETQLVVDGDPARNLHLSEADRLLSEIIAIESYREHPTYARALLVRSSVRAAMGDEQRAKDDLAEAQRLAPNAPDQIRSSAMRKLERGDDEGALELLLVPSVSDDVLLVAMRARLRASKDAAVARDDLTLALALLNAPRRFAPDWQEEALVAIAETQVVLGDADAAEKTIGSLSPTSNAFQKDLLAARVALMRDNAETAIVLYASAATRAPKQQAALVDELASNLVRLKFFEQARRVLTSVGVEQLLPGSLQLLANASLELDDLVTASKAVTASTTDGKAPIWALRVAVHLASRQEDKAAIASSLEALFNAGESSTSTKLQLAWGLLSSGRIDDARRHIEQLRAEPELSAEQMADLALLCKDSGSEAHAASLLLRAARLAPLSARIHQMVVALLLTDEIPMPIAKTVQADTCVLLKDAQGREQRFVVFADGPVDPHRDEVMLSYAEREGLLGRKEGDVITDARDPLRKWTVIKVMPALLHIALNTAEHFQRLFSEEKPFIQAFDVGEPSSLRYFAPLIAAASNRTAFLAEVAKGYREHTWPLGFVAKQLGGDIPGVMSAIASDTKTFGPLAIEWQEPSLSARSVSTAQHAKSVVVTRSALRSIEDLQLRDLVVQNFRVLAPQALRDELRIELKKARAELAEGKTAVAAVDGALTLIQAAPGSPAFVQRIQQLENELCWLERVADFRVRPLATIGAPGSIEEQLRERIGRDSWDAISLSIHDDAALFADDLGLRAVAENRGARSLSSVSMLITLERRSAITPQARDNGLLRLIDLRRGIVPPSADLLVAALKRASTRDQLRWVFDLLPVCRSLGEAVDICAQVLRRAATADVMIIAIGELTAHCLGGLASRWPASDAANALRYAANRSLALLPSALAEVSRTAASFVRSATPR